MEVIFRVVGCAILSFREALFLLEIISAAWATPCYKSRLDSDITIKLIGVLVELLDKV